MPRRFGQLYTHMLPAIESKKTEFHLYGYTTVTEEDIWTFCVQKKWRKKNVEEMGLHEIANGILKVSPAEYMTFTQIEEQRGANWFSDLDRVELEILLTPHKSESEL